MKNKICFITGSRAEYGLLKGLMDLFKADCAFELQIIATNMHLSPEFGLTYKEIESDGFIINKKVEMLLSADTSSATAKSVGLGTIGFADAYVDLQPDLIVVLGDRYEILAAVIAALFFKIPVVHIHGGELTEGAYDDSIRHAITKMSHLHFTSTEEYRKRVIQMGEDPDSVINVGAIGIDNIKKIKLLSKKELQKELGLSFDRNSLLVTYHPVTLQRETAREQFANLLAALDYFPEVDLIFTKPNSDTDGRVIIKMVDEYVQQNSKRTRAFASLGQIRYLSILQFVTAVVGNSSSGIIEVPSFGIPTVNIGDRQKGRVRAKSVIDCGTSIKEINVALNKALMKKKDVAVRVKQYSNPYEKKDTADAVFSKINSIKANLKVTKTFFNIGFKND